MSINAGSIIIVGTKFLPVEAVLVSMVPLISIFAKACTNTVAGGSLWMSATAKLPLDFGLLHLRSDAFGTTNPVLKQRPSLVRLALQVLFLVRNSAWRELVQYSCAIIFFVFSFWVENFRMSYHMFHKMLEGVFR
jgi:hypothetical protein